MQRPSLSIIRQGLFLLLLSSLPAFSSLLSAQSGAEILQTSLERYEEGMEGIDNYTIVQEVMGFETSLYFEKTEVNGHMTFTPRMEGMEDVGQQGPGDPYRAFIEAADMATIDGTESVDGEECYLVKIPNLEGTDFMGAAQGDMQGGFQPREAAFWVDTDDYVVRQMTIRGTVTMQGNSQEGTMTAHMRDYRNIEGMMHPFETQVITEGFGAQMSEEEVAEMRQSLEEMKAQLENMPQAQRQMMEGMMGGQMEQMQEALATGSMDFTVRVKEILVNQGPPSGE